jgi:Excalibur calcium-binding domain
MRRILILIAIGIIGWQIVARHHRSDIGAAPQGFAISNPSHRSNPEVVSAKFTCDGRTMCSQMTSCEEATYFLRNCPGTKMDGDGDGVPCERQFCGSR